MEINCYEIEDKTMALLLHNDVKKSSFAGRLFAYILTSLHEFVLGYF